MFALTDFEIDALLLSLKVGTVATASILPFAILCAWVLSRKSFIGKTLLTGFIYLPLVMPPVVMGLILLNIFSLNHTTGQFLNAIGLNFAFNWKGAALAAAIMAFPLMVRALQISIDNIPQELEETAASLGKSPVKVFYSITLPLALPGIVSATILGFARSLGEFGATITFVSNIPGETQTLPLALYSFTQFPGGEENAIRLALLSACLSLGAIFLSEWINKIRKKSHKITHARAD